MFKEFPDQLGRSGEERFQLRGGDRVWKAPEDPVATWAPVNGGQEFVWVLEISGAVPPNHFANGYMDAVSERQPPMYFPLGGGTIKGVSKPGEIVWSRVFVENSKLNVDLDLGRSVALPASESERRWAITTPQWPIMNAVLSPDQP